MHLVLSAVYMPKNRKSVTVLAEATLASVYMRKIGLLCPGQVLIIALAHALIVLSLSS